MSALLTAWEADVLAHASNTGRYVTGDKRVLALAARGLLLDYGPQALAGGDHYLTITVSGRAALNEWRAAQPKPPLQKRRRRSDQFEGWRSYCEACGKISLGQFVKEVWPRQNEITRLNERPCEYMKAQTE